VVQKFFHSFAVNHVDERSDDDCYEEMEENTISTIPTLCRLEWAVLVNVSGGWLHL